MVTNRYPRVEHVFRLRHLGDSCGRIRICFRRVISFVVDFVFKFGSPYIFMPPLHAYPQEPRPSKERVSYVVLDENTWHTRDS